MVNEIKSQLGFTQRWLPWSIALVALLGYSATLVTWPTVVGLTSLSQVADWDWRLNYYFPLHFLLTYPVRWLPDAWQLTGLNCLAALWSAMTLGLLARCVVLLPHDRTKQQRQLERSDYSMLSISSAWLPPLFAALLCGLQLSFWENAVIETGEALDLLIFATIVWSLLEYRVDEKNGRLLLASFIYGLGITNNYAMIGFLPLFLTATIWIKGLPFFNARFLMSFFGALLAGLVLYLLFPALNSGSDLTNLSFWQTLLVNLGYQKDQLLSFPRYVILITGLTSLAPILFIGIRWPATFGDVSPTGAKLTEFMTQVIHGMFLVACVYVAFDPPFSPRQLGAGRDLLPLYFLGALSAGYFAGYFLLLAQAKPVRSWERPPLVVSILNRVFLVAIWGALVAVPAALIMRNHALLAGDYGRELETFGQGAFESLPEGPAYIISDDPLRLHAFKSILARNRPQNDYVLVDTSNLSYIGYHRYQRNLHAEDWPATHTQTDLNQSLDNPTVLQFMVSLGNRHPLYYLHPSFGYFFEYFYARSHNLVYELRPRPANTIRRPVLNQEERRSSEEFLTRFYNESLEDVVKAVKEKGVGAQQDRLIVYVARVYSMIMNYFGVELQQARDLPKAQDYFQRAVDLNPENPLAWINLDFNRYLQNPVGPAPAPSSTVTNLLAPYAGNWNRLLSANGPVDEPNSCLFLGQAFLQGNNPVQAAQQLYRSLELKPDLLPAQLLLGTALVKLNRSKEALALVDDIRQKIPASQQPTNIAMALLETEAWAYVEQGNMEQAISNLKAAQITFSQENIPFLTLANIYISRNQSTNAAQVYRDQLQVQPNNWQVMVNLSAILINNRDFTGAIELLNRVLEKNPKNLGALMNRAIAFMNTERYSEARNDYLKLQSTTSKPLPAVEYGLGEIAWQEKNYPLALEYYESYLNIAAPGSREIPEIKARIERIQSGNMQLP